MILTQFWLKRHFPASIMTATSSPPLLHVVKDGFFFFPVLLFSHVLSTFLLPHLDPTPLLLLFLPFFFLTPLSFLLLFSFPSPLSQTQMIPRLIRVPSSEPRGHPGKGKLTDESQNFFKKLLGSSAFKAIKPNHWYHFPRIPVILTL